MGIAVLDIGTSSMRGILYDEKGKKLFTKQRDYAPQYLQNDWVEQNPLDWKRAAETVLSACAAWAAERELLIEAVSITSQRSSVIPIGEAETPVGNAIMWQDKRVLPLLKELKPQEEKVFRKTGSRLNPVFSGAKMLWIRRCAPELYEKVSRLVVIPDYVVHEMTGNWVTDATYGSRSLLMDLRGRCWDEELLELFGVEREKLCEIAESGSIVGRINRTFAQRTGLPEGMPVISAGGDQQCAALGMGILRQGQLEVSAGTGAYIIAACEQVPENIKPDVICNASAIPGAYILESSILSCASVFNWFLNLAYGMNSENRKEAYAQANQEIRASLENGEAPLVLPLFQGRGTPDWNSEARGCIHNLTLGTGRGDLARGIMEGLGYEIASNIDIIRKYTGDSREVVLCGGLANSEVFCRILAGICGQDIHTYEDNEATALGAWISAAVTLGLYQDYDSAFRQAREGHSVGNTALEDALAQHYESGKRSYQELYEKLYTERSV